MPGRGHANCVQGRGRQGAPLGVNMAFWGWSTPRGGTRPYGVAGARTTRAHAQGGRPEVWAECQAGGTPGARGARDRGGPPGAGRGAPLGPSRRPLNRGRPSVAGPRTTHGMGPGGPGEVGAKGQAGGTPGSDGRGRARSKPGVGAPKTPVLTHAPDWAGPPRGLATTGATAYPSGGCARGTPRKRDPRAGKRACRASRRGPAAGQKHENAQNRELGLGGPVFWGAGPSEAPTGRRLCLWLFRIVPKS